MRERGEPPREQRANLLQRIDHRSIGVAFGAFVIQHSPPGNDADVGLARASKRRGEDAVDRFEAESRAFHEALREAYRRLALEEPGRFVVIDATEPKSAVADRIWRTVSERLDSASAPAVPAGVAS